MFIKEKKNKYMGGKKAREYLSCSPLQVLPATARILHLGSLSSLLRTSSCGLGKVNRSHFGQRRMPSLPMPSSIPLSSVSTNSGTHSSALRSAPRNLGRVYHVRISSALPTTLQIHGHGLLLSCTEVRKLAEQPDGSDFNSEIFAHPSCRLP